ncbi:hypothetical protein ACROYT_G027680 [Oculina patagonica]
MTELKDIDTIDIEGMITTMTALGATYQELRPYLDEIKDRKKEKRKSIWTAEEVFAVLSDAKREDERKRAILHQFYGNTEDCLNNMDSKVRILLEQNIGNLKDKIAMNKRNLTQKDYMVLVAVKAKCEKGSDYKKIELFLPHSLLKQGIVMVDSPGVGKSIIMDNMVKEYLPEAFAFIYVINSGNFTEVQNGVVCLLKYY